MKNICTVIMISYNHKKYIKKAIESVLEQKTKYEFIIKIFDDCSNDGSADIIREYANKYPNLIEAHINDKNLGAQQNIWNAYSSVDTKYCAILECDDYWCNKSKLQLQIDALEQHPECSFCAHNTISKNIDDKIRKKTNGCLSVTNKKLNKVEGIIKLRDLNLMNFNYMNHINSRVIRTSSFNLESIQHKEAFLYDNCQFYYLLTKGDMYYIPQILSVYNQTGDGIFSGNSNCYKRIRTHILALFELEDELGDELSRHIYKEIPCFINYYRELLKHDSEKSEENTLTKLLIKIKKTKNLIKDIILCR